MASQGQRFRRKALRRGYKVDEVDAFLDRVEATLAGQPVGAPVASQEVHDVVFRVRFNGYDEWQVDLHLDRVERQLAELEERGGTPGGRVPDPRMADRLGPPMRDDRGLSPVPQPPMPPRGMPAQPGPPDRYGSRYDEPVGGGRYDEPVGGGRYDEPVGGGRYDEPVGGGRYDEPTGGGRYDEPTGAFAGGYDGPRGYDAPRGPAGPGPMGPNAPMGHGGPPSRGLPPGPGGYGPDDRFDGFEAGRRGRPDMTAEIRMPDRDLRDPRGRGPAGPPPVPQQGFGGGPAMSGPPMAGPPVAGPPMVGPPMAGPPGSELYRVDQIRRSFQVRRFGSGYDPDQVDRFFETLLGGMQGRNPMPVNPNDLDTLRFGLVPGGYFEAEVDAALKDVQDILLGR
ncbi:DivIVA domain-containing protein [Micromonospora sp. DR5-3]|uniref:DivIVA domain-containing protein n=1 Tax=unclassified Micromonospora TaxID=2617518 RepID=UPI0011D83F44|nr:MULTISPECIES: DivIVA domain-containing protein [unclassified Micromonospora]MCW3813514.1 DivIVA domain-containing protein [Micromonospora sp. DR5-3]TYC24820.1 DivIVA domain-containing protein [Micromonospora sp. MP36]